MSVIIVTDSAASLPSGATDRLGIEVVPMTVVLDGLVYADVDLAPQDLLATASRRPVTTSAPSPGEYLKAISSALEHNGSGSQVVVLTVSSRMSASYEVARTAATYIDDAEIRVVDTATAAGAQGLVVMAAAQCAAAGGSLDAVVDEAERVSGKVRLMAVLHSLDHLARSGRVPQAAAWAGRSLGMRAVFEFSAGTVRPRKPTRSTQAAIERMVDSMLASRPSGPLGHSAVLRGAVLDAQEPEAAHQLHELVTAAVPTAEIYQAPFSSVMIAHTGPGLVGLAWWWDAPDGDANR